LFWPSLIAHREESFLAGHFLFSPDCAEKVSGNFVICCTESPRTTTDHADVTDQILGRGKTRITPIATNPMQLFV
jgi:hypothetical protein